MECKLRCVNFRRVSDPRRAFWPALGVTGISDDWYRSTMGVIAMSLRTPRSAGKNLGARGRTWECRGRACERRGQVWERRREALKHLGAPRITVTHSGKTTSTFRTLMTRLVIIATTYRLTIFKTHVFRLYSHLSIYLYSYPSTHSISGPAAVGA